ncbi:hypothetical protein GOP47_0017719 [Adiantum capillus-veneris]|uniref:non-specific serine/threonine protein kinase n=1 Tax=Adiantum capillus-veneris TaxID=13818 RepID=A0A9D4UFX3_ADICA|nr:hypothetical protein GOP47_0017719 [Adiantum capillus-veneris]
MSRTPSTTAQFHQKSKTLNDKYLLGDEIGKGAYGRVYKGLDLENGDFVAIKQVSLENIFPEDLASIMQEIDLLKNLNHKNIVKYLDSFKTKSHLHIILEYVENGSLASIIKPNKFGAFPESLVAVYISQVLEGLVYLHEQGVIHRDIKGANILTTKEGLVKLADFGVATKLTEADVNTDSVVGTPYWMAPEVIVMSGVSAASDIWSMGCTVIELLTCVPPYYDLQPMTALYRIVEEEHPPIPEHVSPLLADFLHQCFRKDAKLRPDAKTLLQHPWIQNSRRSSYSSVTRSHEKLKSPPEDLIGNGDKKLNDTSRVPTEELINKSMGGGTSDDEVKIFSPLKTANEASEGVSSNTLSIVRNTPIRISRRLAEKLANGKDGHGHEEVMATLEKLSAANEAASVSAAVCEQEPLNVKVPLILAMGGNNVSSSKDQPGQPAERITKSVDQESLKFTAVTSAGELSRFSDTPADGMLDDLFDNSFSKNAVRAAEEAAASDLVSDSMPRPSPLSSVSNGTSSLAAILKAKIAQRKELGEVPVSTKRNEDMLSSLGGRVEEVDTGVADLATIRTQSLEISRLIGLLKPEESEDSILRACQRLVSILGEHPDQKTHFISQHGVTTFMDMLETKNNRVLLSVLQVLNQLAKDNPSFQENACLVGLIPVIMSFAGSECSKEMRMQSAFFVGQLCQTSSTLQMFIACRGLPILVNFLEPDYAKYREMVHIAIDGMWQVFHLQSKTPRNDFCRIFSKNGVLIRLVNTLHSLNEASRLASPVGTNLAETAALRSWSGPLEPSHALSGQIDAFHPRSGQLDGSRVRASHSMADSVRPPSSAPLKSNLGQTEKRHSTEASIPFPNLFEQVANDSGWSSAHQQEQPLLFRVDRENFDLGPPELPPFEGDQTRSIHGNGYNSRQHLDQPWQSFDVAHHHSRGQSESAQYQHDQVQPLISLLEKDPASRPVSGQLEYIRHLQGGLERHESILPLLHHASAIRKNNGELDFLMSAFEDNGKESNIELGQSNLGLKNTSSRSVTQAHGGLCDTAPSTSGFISQSASGFLSVSGILNGRPESNTSSGMLSRMVSTLNADVAREYLEKVADLLLEFSRGDTMVKTHMCGVSLLIRLFQMLNKLENPILLKALKCIKELSSDPCTLEHLQRAEAMKHLIPFLEWREAPMVFQVHSEVLNALYNLCKINKRRQERAAESGIIPHLMHFVRVNSPLKSFALPLLCDMAHASRVTREQLRANKGIELYLSLLDDEYWAVTALDSLAACLAFDNEQKKVEQSLLKSEAIQKLVAFFQSSREQSFVHILEPFLKIITKSPRINVSLATSGLFPLLVARLDHQDAIVRLTLLKLIKAVYEHHPRPKQLIVEYDLQARLQRLIEERRDDQVLVKQMAISLLKALHINCVL